jgi:hypothetical protein
MDYQSVLNILKSEVAADGYTIKLPTCERSLTFRPITVSEQKKLSKLFLPVHHNGFTEIYEISKGLIQATCMNPNDIDFTVLTEIDRALILCAFLSRNYSIPAIEMPCDSTKKECDGILKLKMDYDYISDEILKHPEDLTKYIKEFKLNDKVFRFTLFYPTINSFGEFEKFLTKDTNKELEDALKESKIDGVQARMAKIIAHPSFQFLFIHRIEIIKNMETEPNKILVDIDLTKLPFKSIEDIISNIPLSFFNVEEGLSDIVQNFLKKLIEKTSINLTCPKCGKIHSKVVSFYTFFI